MIANFTMGDPNHEDGMAQVADLAARLGVGPKTQEQLLPGEISIRLRDGRHYPLLPILFAFLDRMDRVMEKT
jgi:hypothetical protein